MLKPYHIFDTSVPTSFSHLAFSLTLFPDFFKPKYALLEFFSA